MKGTGIKYIIFSIAACIVISSFYLLIFKSDATNSSGLDLDINRNQWALLNFGQDVNGEKGIEGYDINAQEVWEITKGNKDVLVGILDTGIESQNPVIKDSIYANKEERKNGKDNDGNGMIDDINGWNFYDDNNKIYERMTLDYHGTFIASVIAGKHTKENEVWGVAPNVTIVPLKFMSGTAGNMKLAIKAIDYGYDLGVRIFNVSWDTFEYDEDLFHVMQKYEDAIFITSSGKGKNNIEQNPVYPCSFELNNVICVSAVDSRGNLETYSGYGKELIFAPGANIYGMLPEGEYVFSDGTSLATAHVTGIVALAMSLNPNILINELTTIIKESNLQIELEDQSIEIINSKEVLDKVDNTR
ncbi:S8 family serine peptidase [Salipaludibacillus sp. HK11]|uniref:S8 family serine peptidase n=1 Tax=Salipaludibacillus sp. HK11 TaxID=3394320 RepID=UPI0039FC370B